MPRFDNQLKDLAAVAQRALVAGRLAEAEAAYRQMLSIQPGFAEVHNDLGNLLCRQQRFDEARPHYERAIALRPNLCEAHSNLGNLLAQQRQLDEAVVHYRRALALRPDNATSHHELAKALKDQGHFDESLAAFDRALACQPEFPEAHFNRVDLKTFGSGDADLAALEALAVRGDRLPAEKMVFVHFALAKACQDLGQFDRAFEHWMAGSRLKRKQLVYDESLQRQRLRQIATLFDAWLVERLGGGGDPNPLPIFILGMPRSGSTLVEQIVASHPLVHGAGELLNFERVAGAALDAAGRPIPYPIYVPQLGPASLGRLGQAYLGGLPPVPAGKTRMTDKAPGNLWYAGLIRLALPGARIIHTLRDPVDTCLSCFTTLFTLGHQFSYDLAELGRYYRLYSELMDHWRVVLPAGSMLEVRYEEVVEDLEGQARRLIEFVGLPWDDRCLSFHTTDRPVSTASNVQVRRPLYRGSVARWRRYERHLGPLLAELAGLATESTKPAASE